MSDQRESPAAAARTAKMIVERSYRARVEELWALWTTRQGFESWWGPEGFRAAVQVLEARAGGRLHYDMVATAPAQIAAMRQLGRTPSHAARARYTEFKPGESLAITTIVDFVPGVPPYETTLRVEFFAAGERVRHGRHARSDAR